MSRRSESFRRSLGLAPLAWLAFAMYAVFLVYPLLYSVWQSFTNRSPLRLKPIFVGFDNYTEMFADDRFWMSLKLTLIVTVFVTVVSNVIGLLFAMLLNKNTANYRLMRTLVFIPQVLSGVIVGIIWNSMVTQNGLINVVIRNLGLGQGVGWVGTPELATMVVCIVVSWMTIAFCTVVYTASLQSVPAELYEAARVDGAGAISRFRNVTIPMIAPGVTISVTLCMITSLKLYDVLAVLTGGGPSNSTKSTAFYVIETAFSTNRFGYASAIAIFLLALTAVLSYITSGLLRRREAHL
ncbi:MAG TPA: sugar ABC transporter permease [Candidatus Lumbricidophila sp.]|nr:sugar ABC transporter permease [Candidatus Lumbricidophila sp.]